LAGRLTIIGGGVMGLMTAYHGAPLAESVTVLDRSRVGDPATASVGLTMYNESAMPVFAYLDIGIYGHPVDEGKTPGVKIGFYDPPDVTRAASRIGSVEEFVEEVAS
jgi:flavin-dependent dehydrogenase